MKRFVILFLTALILTASVFGQVAAPETAEEYFGAGVELIRQQKYAEALDAFKRSDKLEPKRPETLANIGATLMMLKKSELAIEYFQKAVDLAPKESKHRISLCRGLITTRDYSRAISECQEAKRLDPNSVDANSALIEATRLARRPVDEILNLIDTALQIFANDELILNQAAEFHLIHGDAAYAAEIYKRLTDIKPKSAYYFARLADAYLKINRETEAVESARKSLTLDPSNPFAQFFMGKLFFELGLNEEAADAFSEVTAIEPAFPSAKYYLSLSQKRSGKKILALANIQSVVANEPTIFEYHRELGNQLNDLTRYEDAVTALQKAHELNPKDLETMGGLGLALFESAQYEKAIDVLERANRLYPGNEIIQMFLGVSRSRQKSLPKIDELIDFTKKNPKDWASRVELVEILVYARRTNETEQYVAEVWKLSPNEVKPYIEIAVAYMTAGKHDKALDAYRRGLSVKEDVAIYLGFAQIYASRGKYEAAFRAYDKIIELKPNVPGIMQGYANDLRDSGKRREALDMYKRSLALKPINGPVLFNAAILSAKLGDMTSARQYLANLKTVDPPLAKRVETCFRLRLWG